MTAYYFSLMANLWMFSGFLIQLFWFYFQFYFIYQLLWSSGRLSPWSRKWGHWSRVWGMSEVGDQWTSMNSISCLCCLFWMCYALPSTVSVFAFGYVSVCRALFVVKVCDTSDDDDNLNCRLQVNSSRSFI